MGKFSQPRNRYGSGADKGKFAQPRKKPARDLDETQYFVAPETEPEAEASQEVNPQEIFAEGGPQIPTEEETPQIPAEEPEDDADHRDEKLRKTLLIAGCAATAVLLIGIIVAVVLLFGPGADDGLILPNVTVGGVNLGGMTRENAVTALKKATDLTYSQEDMVIILPEEEIRLTPADTGVQLDAEAAVKAAYEYGRTGTREEREKARADAAKNPHVIALLPYLQLDTDYIRQIVDAQGEKLNTTYTETKVELVGDMPELNGEKFNPAAPCQKLVVTIGMPGRYLDTDKLYNAILDAYSFNTFSVTADVKEPEEEPDLPDLDALYEEYATAPTDAKMDMETFEVTFEVYGYGFNLAYAKELMADATHGDVVEIPMEYIEPGVVSKDLSDVLFRDVLASYKTPHTADENRNTNLRLSCEAINGTVLNPGDVFDYNKVVGKRTEERGYKKADAYSGGQTVKELGGGICQVSSTLYYCALLAELDIVDRTNHSYVSTYIPMGLDATVSWGGPEFRFKNNTSYPIRIEAWVKDGYVHVQLIGTDEKDYYVELEYVIVSIKGAEDTIEEVYSDDNPNNYKDGEVIQTAYTGYSIKTYMKTFNKETKQQISRDFITDSVYKSRDKITVKIIEPEETTEATTAPESTTAPETTTAPESTTAPETTTAPESTTAPETTAAPESTTAPETTTAPESTTAPEGTEPNESG